MWQLQMPVSVVVGDSLREHAIQRAVKPFARSVALGVVEASVQLINIQTSTELSKQVRSTLGRVVRENRARQSVS